MTKPELAVRKDPWNRELQLRVRAALKELRFGTVSLVIQDGKVIQIDKSEKVRLT
ncbi:MAG: DUF2292 domain-containing protein [Deltaproteobacteria bacterium]|nr:DUF2292 domain-containing protein [Deltaproteobacteria bacterium]